MRTLCFTSSDRPPAVHDGWWLRLCMTVLFNFETGRCICGLLLCFASLLSGCSSLPARVAEPPSHAVRDGADTQLGRLAAAALPGAPTTWSGVRLLPDGGQALDARIELIKAAQKSIDAQYYLIGDDRSGRQFMEALGQAAARGVRVRLLIDDLYTGSQAAFLTTHAVHSGVALRVFNPLPAREGSVRARVLWSLHDFDRINRRMHNKLLIADNSFAIIGGRNVADEYFGRSGPANFIDMDVLAAGTVVGELSDVFDAYWNSAHAYPWTSLTPPQGKSSEPSGPDARFAVPAESMAADDLAVDVLGQTSLGRQLREDRVQLRAVQAQVIADAPGKVDPSRGPDFTSAALMGSLDLLERATSEVLVVSPYFVPASHAMALMKQASEAGLSVSVITNSAAATDEPMVHSGYARLRASMVKTGIKLYELMPAGDSRRADATEGRPSSGRLHAKMAIIDRRWLYVGSMNMDRRSAHTNTEVGLVIDDPRFADDVLGLMRRECEQSSFHVRVGGDRQSLQWAFVKEGREEVLDREPNLGWIARLHRPLSSLLVSDELL